jgi:DNA processing protein
MAIDSIEKTLMVSSCEGVGPKTFLRLKEHFGSVDEILGASESQLMKVEDIGKKTAVSILKAKEYDPRPDMEEAARLDVQILSQESPQYPEALKKTFDPPIALYVKGTLHPADNIGIAIVGTRRTSQYGKSQAERFASRLGRVGFCIVSGLARGVDSFAHKGSLAVGARTLAVLGSGLSHIYPEENRDLAAEITRRGAIISEFPMRTMPSRENFPRRNRIIAGLTLGTLVVEAPKRSGALITARYANELGREIFAIPGRIDQQNASGVNHLIASGQAKLVQNMDDILEELGPLADDLKAAAIAPASHKFNVETKDCSAVWDGGGSPQPSGVFDDVAEREAKILMAIGDEKLHVEEIAIKTGFTVEQVSSRLLVMRVKRLVTSHSGDCYTK